MHQCLRSPTTGHEKGGGGVGDGDYALVAIFTSIQLWNGTTLGHGMWVLGWTRYLQGCLHIPGGINISLTVVFI